ncbi:hypothetical protein OG381_34330 [Streptomyces sp. NBC_00490]|uniref:hypothetical protein n=1 Tax=Streptomyces sp. NBC_00490 TaxID=2903657 RepID=UPI002E17CF8B
MAEQEWWAVETSSGTQLAKPGELPTVSRFANREEATAVAKQAAPQYDDTLSLVKYTRKEVRTYRRTVSVAETDVPAS